MRDGTDAILGIDFGTYVSKVVCFLPTSHRLHISTYTHSDPRFSPLVYPTVCAIDGENLVVGHRALTYPPTKRLDHIKVCLACKNNIIEEDRKRTLPCVANCTLDRFALDIKQVCRKYIETLLSLALQNFMKRGVIRIDDSFWLNIAMPVDYHDDALGALYKEVVRDAFEIAFRRVVDERAQIGIKVGAFPETAAAIRAFQGYGELEDGLYCIIDVGGGTTNITFFRHHPDSGDRNLSFYSSVTSFVGGNSIADAMLSIQEKGDYLKRQSYWIELTTSSREITCPEIPRVERESLRRTYREAFGFAYRKEAETERWARYNVILTGGASLLPGLDEIFGKCPDENIRKVSKAQVKILRSSETAIGRYIQEFEPKQTIQKHLDSIPPLEVVFPIAVGLAAYPLDIPSWFSPREVKPLPPDEPPPSLTPQDLGYDDIG